MTSRLARLARALHSYHFLQQNFFIVTVPIESFASLSPCHTIHNTVMSSSSSSDDDYVESNPMTSRNPKRKRQSIVLEFPDDDDDDSGDEALFGRKPAAISTTARVTMSNQHKPSSRFSSDNSNNDNDENGDESSVSTTELVKRIKRKPLDAIGKTSGLPENQNEPSRHTQIDSSSMNIRASTGDSPLKSHVKESPNVVALAQSTTYGRSTLESEEEYDKSLSLENDNNDDASSVSTMELARRIRGDPPAAVAPSKSIGTTTATQGIPTATAAQVQGAAKEISDYQANERMPTHVEEPGDLYLPSPLPSDDSSDDEEEEEDGVAHVGMGNSYQSSEVTAEVARGQTRESTDLKIAPQQQSIVREGLRSPKLGTWARKRLLIASGGIVKKEGQTTSGRPAAWQNEHEVEDIGDFSDDDQGGVGRIPVRRESRSIRNVSDPSIAANVGGGFQRSVARFSNRRDVDNPPPRNDLNGGSGVGAGQYQIVSQPSEPTPRPATGGGGGKRGYKKRGRGGGRGRGRRRGSSKGRGRGRGGGRGSHYASGHNNNAWRDYSAQSAPFASNSLPSNLGNVGGAEMSF